jgi:segregation and condensation protein B
VAAAVDMTPTAVALLEGVLFASDAPVEAERIREVLDLESADDARALVAELAQRYAESGSGLQVVEAGGGFRLVTRPQLAPWLVRLARSRSRSRLSRPAVETLAIIAYRQPVSRPEIDAVRGVNSEGVLESLMERRMVRIAGRKEAPGRPFLYETTREFLVAFGLRDVADLPRVDGELVIPDLGAESPTTTTGTAVDDASDADGSSPAENRSPEGEPSDSRSTFAAGTSSARPGPAPDGDPTQQSPGSDRPDQPAGS